MMDQIDAASKPGLVRELLKRHLDGGSTPKVKVKVKMELPKRVPPAKHPVANKKAANQWQGE